MIGPKLRGSAQSLFVIRFDRLMISRIVARLAIRSDLRLREGSKRVSEGRRPGAEQAFYAACETTTLHPHVTSSWTAARESAIV